MDFMREEDMLCCVRWGFFFKNIRFVCCVLFADHSSLFPVLYYGQCCLFGLILSLVICWASLHAIYVTLLPSDENKLDIPALYCSGFISFCNLWGRVCLCVCMCEFGNLCVCEFGNLCVCMYV